MSADDSKIQLQHPQPGKVAPRIDRAKHDLVAAAIMQIVPAEDDGVPFTALADRVAKSLSPRDLQMIGAVGWYTTAVKLDLEARGLIERVPGAKPQRLRRTRRDS